MRVTFLEETELHVEVHTSDWLTPPRVGDNIFIISDGQVIAQNGSLVTIGVQLDAVVLSVTWFGPERAIVLVKQTGPWRPNK